MTAGVSPSDDTLHFVLGSFAGTELDEATRGRMGAGMPGVTLFREHNLSDRDGVTELTAQLHAAAGELPAIVAVDQEGGQLQALTGIVTDFAGGMAIAAAGDPDLARRVGHAMGLELRALGVNVNYAPVCDLLVHATNHGLSIRSFGSNPVHVAALTAATVSGLQSAGVAATAKHFPGKGAARVDTHYEQAIIDRSRAEFDAAELVPFTAAIDAGVRLMMSSHAIVPALSAGEPLPATRSRAVLTGLLRDELGFDGVTITDALDMAAVGAGAQATGSESAQAVLAGADLLLSTPVMDQAALAAALAAAFSADASSGPVLTSARARVIALRRWLATFPTPDRSVVGSTAHRVLADELARRSITDVVRSLGASGGGTMTEPVVVEPASINLTKADTTSDGAVSIGSELAARECAPEGVITAHSPDADDIERAALAARGRDAVVVVTAGATEPGQLDLVRAVERRARHTTVVVARNPLDVAYLDSSSGSRVLCTYGLTESTVRALADVLTGAATPSGTLPVQL
ncbi:MAG: glycoside hydrolase family 3 N-terminal domain-containing protein [Acidimicrobiia bacterium]|nr:glycoside hydrolase family 3 N-terminal domain-containing protein [Acidimicrobiia bacterium]